MSAIYARISVNATLKLGQMPGKKIGHLNRTFLYDECCRKHLHTGGKGMIKMAQLEHIKKMYHLEGLSIREISKVTGHHRDTISKYLKFAVPLSA